MIYRMVVLAGILTAACFAAPETIVFSGNATGTLNGVAFTNQPFSFTFYTDTTAVAPGTFCCTDNITTPAGTPATFSINGVGTGSLTDIQCVFVNESEGQMGMWLYDTRDWLDILWPVGTYGLNANYGPVTGTTFTFTGPLSTSVGPLIFNSVTGATANVTVTNTTIPTPVISAVGTAYGTGVSQNDWLAITGTNLAPASTLAGGTFWVGVQPFTSGNMPTSLNGVSVTVNGIPGYISFYCSASAPSSICKTDQINVLSPIDPTLGSVQVVVTTDGVASKPFTVTMTPIAPAFLQFKNNYVTATHASFSLLGPTSLYPGFSTPAAVGETIVLWAVGFGLPTTAVTQGSGTQSGSLEGMPVCTINGANAAVGFAGVVTPGLDQFNVTVPNGATNGDNPVSCTYKGSTTPSGVLLSVSR
jgi:uncharacterized protein (TIGR03437 family)